MKLRLLLFSLLSFLPCSVQAQGIVFYPVSDGSVVGLDVGAGASAISLGSGNFNGAVVGSARILAYDPVTRLMWYSSTDGQIYSFNIDTLATGPGISGIAGANPGAERHMFIDYLRRNLWVSITDGSIAIYSLSNQQSVGTIPSNFFTDGNVGGLRHFASDQRTGVMWYAATDGTFVEMNPDTVTRTGRTISFGQQTGSNPGAYRHFVVDPLRNLLLYVVTDGSMASINLTTLTASSFTVSSGAFVGADPGAGRTVTYDLQPIKVTPTLNSSSGTLSFAWESLGSNYQYTLVTRPSLSTGGWAPVQPANQWPTTGTSLQGLTPGAATAFYSIQASLRPR